ncbi:RnfABCDGE type electron transport complex subunit G [bacterium]|nr:RnfABCDGE type electron transport complex subunit G [bacterium]
MPNYIKFPLVLIIIAVISAAALTALYSVTKVKKEAMALETQGQALAVVLPQAKTFEQKLKDGFEYHLGKDEKGAVVGYAAVGKAAGYSSVLDVMVGVDTKFQIQAIKVLSQKETPGLGDKVNEILSKKTWGTVIAGTSPDESNLRPWFQIQFDGKLAPIKVDKDGGDVESITGATISSRAVCAAVNQAIEKIKNVN